MYLYQVDNAVTYTSEDLVLFKESPFASWMERLTLENPEHGIPPDPGSRPPLNSMTRQDDIAETLRAEGKQVLLVDWEAEEPGRRTATLEAMRQGVDFIVNGQLALGSLSGSANLLMRTSGFSDLGDYLYIPCDTQGKTTLHSAFRLCFLADLLHSLQGQLPPQMLIIRGGDLVPLQTEDHIYHYRAVKLRFMEAMREFRKHRMPDPSESSQFGRWSECANELLRQRALRKNDEWQEVPEEASNEPVDVPSVAVGGEAQALGTPVPATDTTRRILTAGARPGHAVVAPGGQIPSGPTLAEQARMLATETQAPRADLSTEPGAPAVESYAQPPLVSPAGADAALENLEFIGSASRRPAARHSTGAQDLTLEAPRDLAPEPPRDPAPEPPQDLAPEPPQDLAPEPPQDLAPEPPQDLAPEPRRDLAPEPSRDLTPEPPPVEPRTVAAEAMIEDSAQDVAAMHAAEYLPLEMSPESAPAAADVPKVEEQTGEKEWAAAIDFDMPDLSEPLPLPEVEEISLDGTVLPEGWSDETLQPAAPATVAATAPSPQLAESTAWDAPLTEVAGNPPEPRPHPLDAAVLPVDSHPAVDSDSAAVVVPPAALVTEESALPPALPEINEAEPMEATIPREDPDEPAPRRPFSDSLITNDSFEE